MTVDSYQGEENDIVILSLVRSNTRMGIGFLENRNRAVVALSRARRGLYLFGNSVTLVIGEENDDFIGRAVLWSPVLHEMRDQGRLNLDAGLPLTCLNHGKVTRVYEPGEWTGGAGGCQQKCKGVLADCNHACPYLCHPFPHTAIVCPEPCPRTVQDCGHRCSGICGQACYCNQCKIRSFQMPAAVVDEFGNFIDSCDNGDNVNRRRFGATDVRREIGFQAQQSMQGYQNPTLLIQSDSDLGSSDYINNPAQFQLAYNQTAGIPNNPSFAAPNASTPQVWKAWDAKAADKAVYEQRVRESADRGPVESNAITFEETFRKVELDSQGRRVIVAVKKNLENHYVEGQLVGRNTGDLVENSAAQTLADEFDVIPIPDGPSTFRSNISSWERGKILSPVAGYRQPRDLPGTKLTPREKAEDEVSVDAARSETTTLREQDVHPSISFPGRQSDGFLPREPNTVNSNHASNTYLFDMLDLNDDSNPIDLAQINPPLTSNETAQASFASPDDGQDLLISFD